jgi:hypothetical protein
MRGEKGTEDEAGRGNLAEKGLYRRRTNPTPTEHQQIQISVGNDSGDEHEAGGIKR